VNVVLVSVTCLLGATENFNCACVEDLMGDRDIVGPRLHGPRLHGWVHVGTDGRCQAKEVRELKDNTDVGNSLV
jgi:hypothetical protein